MRYLAMVLMILTMFCSNIFSGEKEYIEPTATDEEVEEIIEIIQGVIVEEEVFIEPLLGFELFYGDFNVDFIYEIPFLLKDNLSRVIDNSWNDPETILRNGYGNLNDFTIMFINIAKVIFDVEYDMAIIDTREYLYLGNLYGKKYHPMPMLDGVIYNVFDMGIYFPEEPLYIYKFNEVFNTVRLDTKTIL